MQNQTTTSMNWRQVLVRALGHFTLVLVLSVVVWGTGCPDGGQGPKNELSGKVTLNGQAVAGELVLIGADNKEYPTPIKTTGEYIVYDPPPGTVKIMIRNMGGGMAKPPTGLADPGAGAAGGGGVAAPAKFSNAKTPLTFEVKPGKQTFLIELEKY